MDCENLTSIDVASGNVYYQSIDGVLFTKDGKTIHRYPAGKKGSYSIPESVTRIGDDAFYGCCGLTTLTIPESVTSIGEWAFEGCNNLTIRAPIDSAAIKYAKEKGIKFVRTIF